ncbi:hypothetical protein DVH24_019860 [Malus domestica]|uniref:Uncharacterized protein n=1 Tax=Malus domestica TaxID=3750 RepID=A0A498I420_MALDO|nr:hypothetical protein DVH24_019860 [Malus domestica]
MTFQYWYVDIHFAAKVKEQMYMYCHNSIITKFVGKCYTYNFVLARLKQGWNLKGSKCNWLKWKMISLLSISH